MDYTALRQQADLRLSQELTRIRNLPKRSKIKTVNTYGLKHASHTNAGLLRGLDNDLRIINREQRRVVNDLNKRRREFIAHWQRTSLPRRFLAPALANCEERKSLYTTRRKVSEVLKPNAATLDTAGQLYSCPVNTGHNFREMKKGKSIAMAKRSKTRDLSPRVRSNSRKIAAPTERLSPLQDRPQVDLRDSVVNTRLVNTKGRANTFKRSCFPSLLTGHTQVDRDRSIHFQDH